MNECQVPAFNHAGGVGHALLGYGASCAPAGLAMLIALGFMYYEFQRIKTDTQRIGNLGEFATGYAVGFAINSRGGWK